MRTPRDSDVLRTSSHKDDSFRPYTVRIFSGTMGRNMSVLMSAAREPASTVGCAAKYLDPSKPFSSAVTQTSRIERLSGAGDLWNDRAKSSKRALPEPLSMAPL